MNLVVAHALSRPTSNGRLDPNGEDFVVTGINASGLRGRQPGSAASFITHALSSEGADASEDGTGRGTPMVVTALRHLGNGGPDDNEAQGGHLVAYGWNKSAAQTMSVGLLTPALSASPQSNPAVGVRRLTPLECERLQGFPDGWTCLCLPLEAYDRDPDEAASLCKCPDSPRYRALGNAVTVNVIEWIGRRLVA